MRRFNAIRKAISGGRPQDADQRPVPTDKALLRNADRITLGSSCQLQFWQPVPVSTSARLDMVSGHRFAEPVQAVLLMADTLVIGPETQSHIQVPDMTQPLDPVSQQERPGGPLVGKFTDKWKNLSGARPAGTGGDVERRSRFRWPWNAVNDPFPC